MTLHEMSISEIQQALSAGDLSAHDIARQTLEAITRINPHINAWTTVTEERMLAEAENIDTLRREKRPLPPLAGIPYAVKNLFDVAGHTTLAGAELFSQRPPPPLTALRYASCAVPVAYCRGWSTWMPTPTALRQKTVTTAQRVTRTM